MSVQDYSTTPSSNTTIAGINVGEGCAPANINNAIRQLMADLAVWAGDMVVGEDVQAYSAKLKALADLTWAANKLIYSTGSSSLATSDLTSFARSLLDDTDAAAARATLALKALATKDKAAAGDIDVTGTPGADKVLYGDRWEAPVFSKHYNSGQQPITSAGLLTLSHGMGVSPKLIQISVKIISSVSGFSVGDEVLINAGITGDAASGRGTSVIANATNINVRFGNATQVFSLLRGDTGAFVNVANGSAELIVRAWA